MCPNHPNHFIDQNLLTSCRVTERIKLWDKYANQRIDQHAVKLDFLRKASTANPLFRTKVRLEGRMRIKVPPLVKYHYENPSHLDLSHFNQETSIRSTIKVENEQKEKEEEEEGIDTISSTDTSKKTNIMDDNEAVTVMEVDNPSYKGDITEEKHNSKRENNEERCINKTECPKLNSTCKKKNNITCYMNQFTYNVKEGIQLLERPVLEALAYQRLEQILNPEGENYSTINCQVRARAALFSLNKKPKPPVFMIHKTMTIGNGPNCDLVLSNYGSCSFTSSKHAIIFFDEATNHYELLNYSEYGTIVDDVLYSCNYTEELEGDIKEENDDNKIINKEQETSEMVKAIIYKENPPPSQETKKEGLCKCSMKQKEVKRNDYPQEGWEGSAIISHGSIISFGCLTFVFNTVNSRLNH